MSARPVSLSLAVVLLALIGAGLAFIGLMLVAVSAGLVAFLAGGVHGFVALFGALSLGAAAMTWIAAGALWSGRPAGWAISLIVAVAAVVGALVALGTSGAQAPTLAGLTIGGIVVALLVAPETRAAARV